MLGNLLTGKGTVKAGEDTVRAGEGTIKSLQKFLMPPHPVTNFEIQKYYQNQHETDNVYLRTNLPKIKEYDDYENNDKIILK